MCNDEDFDIRLIEPKAKMYDWSLKSGADETSENTKIKIRMILATPLET